MKNNDFNGNQEAEKLLKDKMNELSSSVNCFDRISAKAFPEKNADFSESGFVVCDLENITGKSRKADFLKWTALVATFAVCIAVIPKVPIWDNIMARCGKSARNVYSKVIDEINTETLQNTYKVYDIPLDDYVRYDTLFNPLYPCPFSDCGKENINVRIFVRMYGDYPTNQIYAVEYSGEYEKSNFIAVADTGVKFTEEDFEGIDVSEILYDNSVVNHAVMANFKTTSSMSVKLTDVYDKEVYTGSFDYVSIFKTKDGVYPLVSQVLYYGDDADGDGYQYDINNISFGGNIEIDNESMWENSLRYDGFSAMPETSESLFKRTELFDNGYSVGGEKMGYAYVTPEMVFYEKESGAEDDVIECNTDIYNIIYSYSSENINNTADGGLVVPYDVGTTENFKMYFSQWAVMLSSSSNPVIAVTSQVTKNYSEIIYTYGDNYYSFDTESDAMWMVNEEKDVAVEEIMEQEQQAIEERHKKAEEFVRDSNVNFYN